MTGPKFTPDLLIEAPRRSPAVPNAAGTYALYTVSTYSIESKTEIKETKVLCLKTQEHLLFSDDPAVQSAQWLEDNLLLWTKSKDGGKTEFWIGSVGTESKK